MTEPGTGTAQVMGSHLLDGSLFGSMAHDPPNHLLADTRTPHGAAVSDTTEDQPVLNASNRQPFIHRSLYPGGHRHRAHMTSAFSVKCPKRLGQRAQVTESPVFQAVVPRESDWLAGYEGWYG